MSLIEENMYGVVLFSLFLGAGQAEELSTSVPARSESGVTQRHTLKELRDQNIVKQQLDYSCGAAALATLMTGYFGDKTSEKEILELLNIRLKKLTEEEISHKKMIGFSLLDLKYVAEQKGYRAAGFTLTLDQLRQLVAPVIVFVRPFGYHHFAVLRGMAGDRVFLADPARGNLSMSLARFSDEYGGAVFVLGQSGEEKIMTYPLALSRPGDYVRPDPRRIVDAFDHHEAFTIDLAMRARPQ